VKFKKYSQPSIDWLGVMSVAHHTHIQHAENGGEFKILGTRYKADGYSEELNTIYEFHGDFWHAHPDFYKDVQDEKHSVIKKLTYAQVYQRTLAKKKKILSLGYNYVSIWESEWDQLRECIRIKYEAM
jgi:hypothetical protein